MRPTHVPTLLVLSLLAGCDRGEPSPGSAPAPVAAKPDPVRASETKPVVATADASQTPATQGTTATPTADAATQIVAPTTTPTTTTATPVAANAGEPGTNVVSITTLPPMVPPASIPTLAVEWKLVAELPANVLLVPLDAGVLARVNAAAHVLDATGTLVAEPRIDVTSPRKLQHAGEVFGSWPNDAWKLVEMPGERVSGPSIFFKWRAHGKWVAQGEELEEGSFEHYQRSPRNGMMLASRVGAQLEITRIAAARSDPAPLPAPDADLEGVFEVPGGIMFGFYSHFHDGNRRLEVTWTCGDEPPPGCPAAGSVELRPDPLPQSVGVGELFARDRWGLTAELSVRLGEGSVRSLLLHRAKSGWSLEGVPADADVRHGLVAPDGALWLRTKVEGADERLWVRRHDGSWVAIATPGEITSPQTTMALRDDGSLLVAVNDAEHHRVYSTSAVLANAPTPG